MDPQSSAILNADEIGGKAVGDRDFDLRGLVEDLDKILFNINDLDSFFDHIQIFHHLPEVYSRDGPVA